jgi:type VI secretion system protein ImpM
VTNPDPTLLPGFFGKVPARGDFVLSRLPRGFVEPWDDWLQDCMVASRRQSGEDWIETYLSCPVWFFALTAGLCGEHAVAGLLMTSVDSVGRHFPFTLAAPLPTGSNMMQLPSTTEEWFMAATNVAVGIRGNTFDFETFDESVKALGPLPTTAAGTAEAISPASIWWTAGDSDSIRIRWPGMPPEDEFATLLCAGRRQQEPGQDTATGAPVSPGWAPEAWEPGTWPDALDHRTDEVP